MKKIYVKEMRRLLLCAADKIIEKEPYLTELDMAIGDGDHGTGMKRGFTALKKMLECEEFREMDTLCKAVGVELLKSMGGASGVIFGTMFLGGIRYLPHEPYADCSQLVQWLSEGEASVERRGKTKPGQKTMLDALMPAVTAMGRSCRSSDDIVRMLQAGSEGAIQGMEESKGMRSRAGRSKNFREETIGLPDPGAVSTSLIFEAFAEEIKKCEGKER
ncbi:MAG: dihydroxyacetone kinase subunit L [Lachnospiraceae bacterium]|jgi:dihydroxyacetone kinase-like protein|nr:dihydroxyacetone kinase subunit L [Lachnospiraceae bacterium]